MDDPISGKTDREVLEAIDGALARPDGVTEARTLAVACLARRLGAPFWEGATARTGRIAREVARDRPVDEVRRRLGVRLAVVLAREGRVDDEALLLTRFARDLASRSALPASDAPFADEASAHFERAVFLPSAECAHDLAAALGRDGAAREAEEQLGRKNPTFAALLAELAIAAELSPWRIGPPIGAIEKALRTLAVELARNDETPLDELALVLARAYAAGGFVDGRARDHVRAYVAAREPRLDAAEAERLKSYAYADAFDESAEECWEIVRAAGADELRTAIARRVAAGNFAVARRLCELALARRLDPWRIGDPAGNVERAMTKARERPDALDDAAALAARVLALLIALAQDPAPVARALVASVFDREMGSPELAQAFELVGLERDIAPQEVLRLYQEATDPAARIERFRAHAEAAGLSDYERAAYRESIVAIEARDEALGAVAQVTRRLSEIVESVVPDALLRSASDAVEGALRTLGSGASRLLARDRILRAVGDPAISSLETARRADLRALDAAAWSITHENRVLAALEGFGCGLGGASLVLVDVPALIAVNLNAVLAIATVYGFDVARAVEVDRAFALLAGGARWALASDIEGSSVAKLAVQRTQEGAIAKQAALGVHVIARRIAARIAKQKLAQLVPVLGGAVGAGLNFHFTHQTTRAAVEVYRLRWLERRVREAAGP